MMIKIQTPLGVGRSGSSDRALWAVAIVAWDIWIGLACVMVDMVGEGGGRRCAPIHKGWHMKACWVCVDHVACDA